MSSKKLRLEMDSISESNSPGGGGGDANASTSAGGRSVPYRGKYTRPLGGGSLTPSSRFSPYSISRDRPSARRSVPLIRARRDEGGSTPTVSRSSVSNTSFDQINNTLNSFGSTSSTAQKIMETLANMSTPVLNAGRVRIDSIKSLKPLPLGSPVLNTGSVLSPSSKFSGPPKTGSPLLLPKVMTGIRDVSDQPMWSLKCLSVPPKTVDSGTNTDESMSNPRRYEYSPTTYNLLPVSSNQASTSISISTETGNIFKNSLTNDVGKFKFREPWSIKEIDNFVDRKRKAVNNIEDNGSSDEDERSAEKKKAMVNGDVSGLGQGNFKGTGTAIPARTFGASATAAMFSPSKWECPNCSITNKLTNYECFSCGKPQPVNSIAKSAEKRPSLDKTDSMFKPSASSKWTCPTCMVPNDGGNDSCVCCTEPNPNQKKNAIQTSSSNPKWTCPTCMVPNESTANSCVCCSEANPNKKNEVKASLPAKKWTCPTCMVPNEATANACVCCTERNPNPVASGGADSKTTTAPIPNSAFKFGFSSSSTSKAEVATTSTSSSGNFTFGSSAAAPKTSSSSGFTFGATSQPNKSSTDSGFVFGFKAASQANQTTVAPTLSATTTATTTSSGSTGFSFGLPSSNKSNLSSTASSSPISFGLGSSNAPKIDNASESTPEPAVELWKCDVCPSKNKFELHSCKTCASPRPKELDPNYKKPEEKPKSELKFDPIFSGVKSSVQPPSTNAGSLFSSIATSSASIGSSFGGASTFGTGTTFSSGNPFGGGGSFGSGSTFGNGSGATFGSGSGPTFGSASTANAGSTFGGVGSTTATTSTEGASTGLTSSAPSFSTPGSSSSSQGFQFGTPSTGSPSKRKLDDQEDIDPAKKFAAPAAAGTFMFGASSTTPALKLKETVTPAPVQTTPATSAPPTNNEGFLQALKNASAAVKASTEKQSNTVTSTSGPAPSKVFEFGSGGISTPAGPGFGAPLNQPQPNPNLNFTFGSGTPALTPAPTGMNPVNPQNSIAPPVAAPAVAAAPFSLTPNFNFGASAPSSSFNFGSNPSTGAAAPGPATPLFQFSASGGPGGSEQPQRKIKRATRRFNR